MIKDIEIWDFESHKHTHINGLDAGLNAIFGLSNAGKSSIVRALSLVAYNEFNPKSVRVGEKRCKVKVTTERGTVQVTRGATDNLWEVWNGECVGKPTHSLNKPGKAIVPQAAEVMGLSMVKLGDIPVPVNIMDQLENHFMLSGVGDKDATGSVRAQIIDEISGLSGVESIIKSVSLDNHRSNRQIRESGKEMDGIRDKMHDEDGLDRETRILTGAGEKIKDRKEILEAQWGAEDLVTEFEEGSERIVQVDSAIAKIPDTERALNLLEGASSKRVKAGGGTSLYTEASSVTGQISTVETGLSSCLDTDTALAVLECADDGLNKISAAENIVTSDTRVSRDLQSAEDGLAGLDGVEGAPTYLKVVEDALGCVKDIQVFIDEVSSAQRQIDRNEIEIQSKQNELDAAIKNHDDILKSVKVCPLNPSKAVSPDCVEGAKVEISA